VVLDAQPGALEVYPDEVPVGDLLGERADLAVEHVLRHRHEAGDLGSRAGCEMRRADCEVVLLVRAELEAHRAVDVCVDESRSDDAVGELEVRGARRRAVAGCEDLSVRPRDPSRLEELAAGDDRSRGQDGRVRKLLLRDAFRQPV
jgi:hypothetical protein